MFKNTISQAVIQREVYICLLKNVFKPPIHTEWIKILTMQCTAATYDINYQE